MQNSRNIKACLDKLLENNDKVFIVPHNRPDMDALGASIGMSLICSKKGKENFIVIDDKVEKLEAVTKKVIESIKGRFNIIKASNIQDLITENSLMIAVDVNKENLISVNEYIDNFTSIVTPSFSDIFILDHHNEDEHTIKNAYKFIDDKLSSTCEEVSRLLFLYGVKLRPDEANYLLAGILLDTNKLNSPSVSTKTIDVIKKLTSKGANLYAANNMFVEDFEHDRAIQRLVSNTGFLNCGFAVASDNTDKIFEIEDIAKAADYLLKYQVNAAFAMAYIDKNVVSISARGKGIVDVSKIMRLFGGDGNEHSAAARIRNTTVEEVKDKLCSILSPTSELNQIESKEDGPSLKLSKQ